MEDTQFEFVSLYGSRSKKRCMEYALVLQAVGIRCEVLPREGDFALVVPAPDAERAREQHSGPRQPPAQKPAGEKAEDEAEDQVAGQVDRVGVKAQRRHGAPPLALADQTGVAHARPPPIEGEGLVPLQDVDDQYARAIEARADQSVMNPEARIDVGRSHRVLPQIKPKLLPGVVRVLRIYHQSEPAVAGQHLASDAHGLEHEGVFRAALPRTRSAKRDDFELGILHGASERGADERVTMWTVYRDMMDYPLTAQWNKIFMDEWLDMHEKSLLKGVPVKPDQAAG